MLVKPTCHEVSGKNFREGRGSQRKINDRGDLGSSPSRWDTVLLTRKVGMNSWLRKNLKKIMKQESMDVPFGGRWGSEPETLA